MILAAVFTFLILLIIPIFFRPILTLGALITNGKEGNKLSNTDTQSPKPNVNVRKGIIIFYLLLFTGSIIWMGVALLAGLGRLALIIILMALGFLAYLFFVSIPAVRHVNETRKNFPRPSSDASIGQMIDWENKVHDENMSYKIPMKYYTKVTIPFILWNVILIILAVVFVK